jgi:hypothetical protein
MRMTEIENLDTRIAKALTDDAATPDQLNELIELAAKAAASAEQAAAEARAKATNPRVVDGNASIAVAYEQEALNKRYTDAHQQLAAKVRKTELAAARAACNEDADKTQTLRDEVEAAFNQGYAEIVEFWAHLVKSVEAMTREVARVNNSAMNDTRRVLPLDQVTKVMAAVKLPDPQNTQRFLWPVPVIPPRMDMLVPTMGKDSRRYSGDWAAAQADERAAARKKEHDERRAREEAALKAHPNQVRWWAGETA